MFSYSRNCLVSTFLMIGLATGAGSATADGVAFIANRGSDNVTVLDLGSSSGPPRVLRSIDVVQRPEDLVFSADGGTLYVPNDKDLSVIDVRTLEVRHIRFSNGADDASSAVVHPNGRQVYVSHDNTNYISLVDTVSGRVDSITVPVLDVNLLAISDDGQFVYGVGNGAGDVFQLEVASNQVMRIFEGAAPLPKGILAAGQDVIITSDYNLEIVSFTSMGFGMISPLSRTTTGTIRPGQMADGLNGSALFVTPFEDAVVNASFPGSVAYSVPSGSQPSDASASDVYGRVVAANQFDPTGSGPANQGSVTIFESQGTELATFSVGLDPRSIEIGPQRGVELLFNPIATAFPLSPKNAWAPITRTTQVRNVGDVATRINSLAITGADAQGFRIRQEDCTGRSLAYQETCQVEVEFSAFPKNNPFPNLVKRYIPSYNAGLYVDATGVDETGATGSLRAGYFLYEGKVELKEEVQATLGGNSTLIWGD